MSPSTRHHYEVLGVGPDASVAAIEAAYRRLCRRFHPDLNHHPEAERRMKEINAAYEALVRRRRASVVSDYATYQPPRGQAWRPHSPRSAQPRSGAPALFVADSLLDLGEVEPGKTPLGRVEVRNVGGGLLHGQVTGSAGWVRCTPATFDANRLTIQVFAEAGMMSPGVTLRATLTIRTNGGTAQVEVLARLRSAPQPEVALQPATLLLGDLPHGLVTAANVEVRNVGIGTLRGSVVSHQPWLRAEPLCFVGNVATVTVQVDMHSLAPGLDHYSAVELHTNGGVARLPVQVYVARRQGLRARAAFRWRALVANGQALLRRLATLVR